MSYGLSPKQIQAIANSTKRVNIWDGAVRSGKTFGWILIMLNAISNHNGQGGILIVGKNRDSIYRNVFEPIEQQPEFALFAKQVQYRQGAAFATIFGHKCHVVGANDAGSESRIRGMTLALAFADEITILDKQFFKQLLARLSKKGAQLYCTTNPDTPGHWLMTEYLQKIPEQRHYKPQPPENQLTNWTYWHFTMDDNPSLDPEYKTALKREYTGVWYKRMIQGQWVAADGAIYDFFDTEQHTIPHNQIPPIQRTISLGIDYGTTHPTAGILIGIGDDNKLYALDEWAPNYQNNPHTPQKLTDKQLSDHLKQWLQTQPQQPEFTWVDPAAGSFRQQLWEDRHPHLAKAKNDVLDGIRTVAALLANGDLLISQNCQHLIQELPGYRWDEKATQKGEEKPIKTQDDFSDALRYAVYSSRKTWSRYTRNQQ